jgi:hypothetical protein
MAYTWRRYEVNPDSGCGMRVRIAHSQVQPREVLSCQFFNCVHA